MEVINRQGPTVFSNTLTAATITTVTQVAAGSNVRGIIVYTGWVDTEDLPDSVAYISNNTDPSIIVRALRGGFDRLAAPVFIPPGKALSYSYLRSSYINFSYQVL